MSADDELRLMHHAHGPATEVAAAAAILPHVAAIRAQVEAMIRAAGPAVVGPSGAVTGGVIGDEFIAATGHGESSARTRFTELARDGVIRQSGHERDNRRNRGEVVWELNPTPPDSPATEPPPIVVEEVPLADPAPSEVDRLKAEIDRLKRLMLCPVCWAGGVERELPRTFVSDGRERRCSTCGTRFEPKQGDAK